MRRSGGQGTLEGIPVNKLDGIPNALGWRLGRSNSATLPRESRDKKKAGSRHGWAICKTRGKEMEAWGGHRIFLFRLLRDSDGHKRTAFQATEWECPASHPNERLPVPARHVSRRHCQGVKESRLIEQARLWRSHARLPPAWSFALGRTRDCFAIPHRGNGQRRVPLMGLERPTSGANDDSIFNNRIFLIR
jgi:hypothetical protein